MVDEIISEKNAIETGNKLCKDCRHIKADHIFWNSDKLSLELKNCNVCECGGFVE